MKNFIIIAAFLLLICGIMFNFISLPHNLSDITAKDGVLDLTDGDFTKTIFTLNGEWEFYYGQLYTPKNFLFGKPEGTFIKTPASWDTEDYPLYGCATYRLTVKTDETELTMLIPEIADSSVVWINGEKVFEAGKVTDRKTEYSEFETKIRNAFVNFRPENGQAEIIVQAANYGWIDGGLTYAIEIGRPFVLLNDAFGRRILTAFVIGLLFAMFFYHIFLFLYRRKERAYLAFALICLFAAVRLPFETNGFVQFFFGMGAVLTHVYLILMLLQTFAVIWFTHIVFEIKVKRASRIVYCVIFVFSLFILLLPYGSLNVMSAYIAIIPFAMTLVSIVRSKRLKENLYNGLYLLAMIIFILWNPLMKFVLEDNLYMPMTANNLFLILSQCVVLSVSYAETKRREEELRAKTEFYRKMSHDLRTPLTIVSTSVQVAKNHPEGAGKLLTQSQEEIMKMSEMIDKVLSEGVSDSEEAIK